MALIEEGTPLDSLRSFIMRDSIPNTLVRKGFFQKGDNQFVDQTEWKEGVVHQIPSTVDKSTVIVCIREVHKPEQKTLKEAKGLVTSDYQTELEGKWIEALRAKYPVKVDEKVLEEVRNLYK